MDPQNVNARYLDKFGSNKTTSVKIHHPPGNYYSYSGGQSNFSLGWEEPKTTNQYKQNQNYQNNDYQYEEKKVTLILNIRLERRDSIIQIKIKEM